MINYQFTNPNAVRLNPTGDSGWGLFAHGGHVAGLREAANRLKHYGEEGDTILAHINPEEAHFLHHHFGSNTNPHTGLPQFGLLRKLEKALRPVTKKVLPLAGAAIGGAFGGPLGAVIGGSMGGALSSSSHPLDHAIGGGFIGLGHSVLSPMLGQHLGLDPKSFWGKAAMMDSPGLGQQMSSFLPGEWNSMGGSGLPTELMSKKKEKDLLHKGIQVASGSKEEGGMLSKIGIKSPFELAMLATMVGGSLGAKTKTPKEEKTLEQVIYETQQANHNSPHNASKPPRRGYYNVKPLPPELMGIPHPEHGFLQETAYRKGGHVAYKPYGKGGKAAGYVDGHSGGQTDDVPTHIPEGSYVMDATTVSLLGDGNSDNGAKKLSKMEDSFLRSGIVRNYPESRNIKAKISDGEYVMSKQAVDALGNGDNRKGSKVLNTMRKNLRKHKGVDKFLPPKSKNIAQYMR